MSTMQRRKRQLTPTYWFSVSHLFRESRSVSGWPLFSWTRTDPSLGTQCCNRQTLFHDTSLVLKPTCSVMSCRAAPERRSSWEWCYCYWHRILDLDGCHTSFMFHSQRPPASHVHSALGSVHCPKKGINAFDFPNIPVVSCCVFSPSFWVVWVL